MPSPRDLPPIALPAIDTDRNLIILTLASICDDTKAGRFQKIDALKDVILAAQMRLRAFERGARSV